MQLERNYGSTIHTVHTTQGPGKNLYYRVVLVDLNKICQSACTVYSLLENEIFPPSIERRIKSIC